MTSLLAMPSTSHNSNPEEEWLGIRDVAALLHVPVDTVRRWADDGHLKHWRPPGTRRHRRFRRADVDEFKRNAEKAS